MKPANIMLTHSQGAHDAVTVLDFGLVKTTASDDLDLTQAGLVVGTPAYYMAPESVVARPISAGDLYAVGCKDPGRRPTMALAPRDSLINCTDAGGWTRRRADEW